MLIRYVGELLDPTGYGEAARYNVALLHKMGHDLQCVSTISQETTQTDWKFQIVKDNLIQTGTSLPKPDLVITHIYPPKNIIKYKIPGVPLIAYIAWETDLLPTSWAYHLNKHADMVVTTCTEMKSVIEKGVNKPVEVLGPTYFDQDVAKINTEDKYSGIQDDGTFKFYSVFQWIERKDPEKLIAAFIQEFDETEDVSLVLKTYRLSYDKEEFNVIVRTINRISQECCKFKPPKILLVPKLLSHHEMQQVHNSCDCYVSPHRGEGTGLGMIDSALHNNQILVSEYGGPSDFFNFKSGDTPMKLAGRMVPVQNPLYCFNYFNSNMNWFEADTIDLRNKMRFIYNTRHVDQTESIKQQRENILEVYGERRNIKNMQNILNGIEW